MRHGRLTHKLGVNSSHRKAMLRSLTLALIEHDTIKTTPARAKAVRRYAERVVTLAKRGDLGSRRHVVKLLGSTQNAGKHSKTNRVRRALDRLYNDIAPRFATRNGGYTQILKLGVRRLGDNAELCIMRYLPDESKQKAAGGDKGAKKTVKASKAKSAKSTKKTATKKTAKKKAAKPAKKKTAKSKAKDK